MDRSLLDQLVVPQPPYRMARPASPEFQRGEPVAVLAAVGDTPPKPSLVVPEENLSLAQAIEEQEAALKAAPEPMPEVSATPETGGLSLVEAMEQQEAAIEAARQTEEAKLDAAPPLPPEANPDEVAKEAELRDEGKFQVNITAADVAAEARALARPEPVVGDKTPYGEVIAVSPDGKPKIRYEAPARTPEQKAADNVIATKLRQEQEERTKPKAKEETTAEQVARIGQEALNKLNEFEDLRTRGADAEAIQQAKVAADAAQREFDAVRRGDVPSGDQTARTNAMGEALAASSRRAQERATAVEATKKTQPNVGEVVPGKGTVSGYDERGRAIYGVEERPKGANVSKLRAADQPVYPQEVGRQADAPKAASKPRVEKSAPTPESGAPSVEQGPNFENVKTWEELDTAIRALASQESDSNWLDFIPMIEGIRERAKRIPVDQIASELAVFIGNPLKGPLERLLAAERGPSEPAQEPAVPEAGPTRTREQGGVEREGERSPSNEFSKLAEQILAQKEEPNWFGQEWMRIQALGHNLGRFFNSVLAKRNKDLVASRQSRLADLEKEAEAYAAKSWRHTAAAAVLYGPRINWYREGIEQASAALESREEKRKRHEDAKVDLINLMVVREEVPLKSTEKKAELASEQAKKYENKIAGYYAAHREATETYIVLDDPDEKLEKLEEIKKLERQIQTALKMRSFAQKQFVQKNGQAADRQAEHNILLRSVDLPQQPKTAYGPRRKERARKKPKMAEEQQAA